MQNDNLISTPHISPDEARKNVEAMNLIEGFLFDSTLENEDDAKVVIQGILKAALNREIKNIKVTPQKTFNGVDTRYHGIRLDAHITQDDDGSLTATIYDVEMENREADKLSLPKRFRYYGALSDVKLINTGKDYMELPDFVSITISSYDPFNAGDMYYAAKTIIVTHPEIQYDDGILHIYLYCNGKVNKNLDKEHSKYLAEMLKYIVSGEKPTTPNADIDAIDNIVTQVKNKPEVTINYMKQWDRENQIRRESINDGIKNTTALFSWLKSNGREADVLRAIDDPDYLSRLFTEYEEWKKKHKDSNNK